MTKLRTSRNLQPSQTEFRSTMDHWLTVGPPQSIYAQAADFGYRLGYSDGVAAGRRSLLEEIALVREDRCTSTEHKSSGS